MADNNSSPTVMIANPAPLGLLAFGMTTVLLSMHNLGLFGLDSTIIAMGIFYGGLAQIFAGLFEFRNGNTFGATAFTSYGLFWLTFVFINTDIISGLQPADNVSLGAYFAIWGILTLFLYIGTLRGHRSLQIVFLTLAILFFVVAAKDASGIAELAYLAGAVGILCGGSAMYTAFGEVLNETYDRPLLPLG
ncbi:MAG: acetate uptake transporter [Candidatus Methanomethylophilaceae archaeon]